MAVTRTTKSVSMLLYVETGVTATGATEYSTVTFSKVNPALADADFYDVASAIGTLQYAPVGDIARRELQEISRS